MRLVALILVAVAILLAPLIWLAAPYVLPEGGAGPAVDSSARIEIERLRERIDAMQQRIDSLESDLSKVASRPTTAPPPTGAEEMQRFGPNTILNAYAKVVLIANRKHVNDGLTTVTPSYLAELFGRPREDLSDDCQPVTNPTLKDELSLEQVGPIRVRMLKPAIASLRKVFEKIKSVDSDLYERITTAGALCVRRIRGTTNSLSSHAYGLAVDLNVDGHLDNFTDGKTQLGLTILADFFHSEGWIWGAGFSREDSMHFEVSREKLAEWQAEGRI
ncbi:MAG: M15 family metallopeptidase [Paracoccaceae bacterium]